MLELKYHHFAIPSELAGTVDSPLSRTEATGKISRMPVNGELT